MRLFDIWDDIESLVVDDWVHFEDFVGFSPWLSENKDFVISVFGLEDHFVVDPCNHLLVKLHHISKFPVVPLPVGFSGLFFCSGQHWVISQISDLGLINLTEASDHRLR